MSEAAPQIAIFSDLHISSEANDERRERFVSTLKKLRESSQLTELWLLGDIFDLLIGPYDFWLEIHRAVFSELEALRQKDCRIIWLEGNHDFFIADLGKQLGIDIIDGTHEHVVAGKRLHLAHGDLANDKDKSYAKWRAFTRSKLLQRFLAATPGALAEKILLPLGEAMSNHSRRRHGPGDDPSLRDLYREYARRQFAKGAQGVFLGHCHIEDLFIESENFYLNLGSWLGTRKVYALWSPASQKYPEIILARG